jgi:phage-related protein
VAILAATPLLWIAPGVNAQSSSPSSQESRTSPNSDITRQELARFDQFLDGHQEIAEQLRRDPSLVNDQNYVQATPELQTFLQDHPGVREEIRENPNYFMRQENRYDRGEDNMRRQELARFDQFLDSHREVSEQLRRDPSLVKDQQFLQSHPALQSFLQDHPTVREDLQRNPNAFMRQENQYDRQEARQDSLRRAELAQFDRFLDSHRETAEQLRRDPSLVKSQQFVQSHPALQSFLQEHQDIRQQLDQNPNAFMRQENQYDRREEARDDASRRAELAQFDRFLDSHRETAEQLRRDPSLAKNQQFVQNHPALQSFLQQHPDIQQRLDQNPNAFMRQENRFDANEDARNRDLDQDDVRRNRDFDRDDARRNNDRDDARDIDARDRDADNRNADRDRNDNDMRERNDRDRDSGYRADNDARQDARNGNHGQVASFDQFLDKHQEIAEQLRRDPSLAKNQQFISTHPALQAYLQDHQGVREQLYQNPNALMQQEKTYESRENGMGRGDMNREHSDFGQFLGTHSGISGELSKNPSLLKNHEYMSSHPELQAYLTAHPDAQSMMAKDPDSFMKASQQFSSTKTGTTTSTTTGTTGTVKATPDATKPAETPKPPKQQ